MTHPVMGFSKDAEICGLIVQAGEGMGGSWPGLQWTRRKETV